MGVAFILFLFAGLVGLVGSHGLRGELSTEEFVFMTLAGFACVTVSAGLIFKDVMLEARLALRTNYSPRKWHAWAGVIVLAWLAVLVYVIRAVVHS